MVREVMSLNNDSLITLKPTANKVLASYKARADVLMVNSYELNDILC